MENKKTWVGGIGILLLVILLVVVAVVSGGRSKETGQVYKIGSISALTGVGSSIGEQQMKGAQLAVEEINASGGVNGSLFELVSEDVSIDKMNTASTVVQKLTTIDRVVAMVGPQWDEPMAFIGPIAESSQTPVIAPDATENVESPKNFEYVFATWPDNKVGITALLRFAESKGWKNISLVRSLDGGFWKYTHDLFVAGAPKHGITIVSDYDLGDVGMTDFRPTMLKLKNDKPDAVFFVMSDFNECNILRQAKQIGVNVPFMATESAGNPQSIADCPDVMEETLFYSTPRHGKNYERFSKRFEERYGTPPLFPSTATAYDAVYVIADALKKTKGEIGPALREAIAKTNYSGGASQDRIQFNEKGFAITPDDGFVVMTVKDGKYILAE